MGEASYPFAAGAGTGVDAARWRALGRAFAATGVVGLSTRDAADTSLKVSLGSGLTMSMADGSALIDGIRYEATSGPLSKTAANNANSQPRIDRFILKLDTSNNSITASIKQGTPGASPSPPSMTFDLASGVVEIPLARATCPGSGSAQNYSSLVDERMFVGSAPAVGDGNAFGRFAAGDFWYRPDFDILTVFDGAALKGVRPEQYAGVPLSPSGVETLAAGEEGTYASITVGDFGWPYKISFNGHFEMTSMGASNWVVARVRQDNDVSGTILAEAQGAPSANANGRSPVSICSFPISIAAGAAHTFYLTVEPNVAADYTWGSLRNRFSGLLTPQW